MRFDPTKLERDAYAFLRNGRCRDDIIQTIKAPLEIPLESTGLMQGLYSSGTYSVLFQAGRAYYRNFAGMTSAYQMVPNLLLSADAPTIWAELVPASTINFSRVPESDNKNDPVNLTNPIGGTPQCLVAGDGINPEWLVLSTGVARLAKNYAQWTVDDREYVPIMKNRKHHGDILYGVSPDGSQLFRSVSGRPLDFMVNITYPAGDKPAATEEAGGAQTSSHRVGYDPITCLASLNDPDGAFLVATLNGCWRVVPDWNDLIWGQPQFDNIPIFPLGPLNQFSFTDVNGDSVILALKGMRKFNAALQSRNEGKNEPFSARILKLFRDVLQIQPCTAKFDDYVFLAVQTRYGAGVVIYDESLDVFVGIDIFEGVGTIKQFSRIQTATLDKLLFITTDNKLYEYFGGPTAPCQLFVGEWCSQDPKVEQKPMTLNVVVANAREAGTLTVTAYVNGEVNADWSCTKVIEKRMDAEMPPIEIPFGETDEDRIQNIAVDNMLVKAGWKVGFLLEWNCDAEISHVSLTSEDETATVSQATEALEHQRFSMI